jgi:hypothetical protein
MLRESGDRDWRHRKHLVIATAILFIGLTSFQFSWNLVQNRLRAANKRRE